MKLKVLLALSLFCGMCFGQASPFSNSIFPSQSFTATGQTGTAIQLNGLLIPSTIGSSFASATIALTGSSLTTVTFAVQGSSDNGVTYYPLAISAVATPGTTATSVTATASGLYQVNLAGLTHVRFVTSGTFTATSISLVLTASPNAMLSRAGGTPNYGPPGFIPFGDSISAATGATNASLGFVALERNQIGGHFFDGYAVSGDQLIDMNKWQHQAGSPFVGGPNTQIETGTNDVPSYGASANLQTVFQRVYHESLLWGGIPRSNKVFAQSCTKTTGFATADDSYLLGLGQSSTTQNDVLTCNVTTGPNGNIAIGYMIFNGGAGTFGVKVNGVAQNDPLTASATWLAYGDGSSVITTGHNMAQGFAGAVLTGFAANTAVAVAFTVTSPTLSTNTVEPAWVGSFPAASTSNPYVIAVSPNHQNNANDALSGTYAGFISSLVTTDLGYGLNAIYADTRTALGTNYATYYSDTLHPNNAGHALMASTIIGSLPVSLVTNSPANPFMGLTSTYQPNATTPANPMNFPNVNSMNLGDGVNKWSPGLNLGGAAGNLGWIAADTVRGTYLATSGGVVSLCYNTAAAFQSYPAKPSTLVCPIKVQSNGSVDMSAAGFIKMGYVFTPLGVAVASAATINYPPQFFHMTGTVAINTINPVAPGCINIVPDGAFTTTIAGNFATATTAVVGKLLTECYDGTKWYPSY